MGKVDNEGMTCMFYFIVEQICTCQLDFTGYVICCNLQSVAAQ